MFSLQFIALAAELIFESRGERTMNPRGAFVDLTGRLRVCGSHITCLKFFTKMDVDDD